MFFKLRLTLWIETWTDFILSNNGRALVYWDERYALQGVPKFCQCHMYPKVTVEL